VRRRFAVIAQWAAMRPGGPRQLPGFLVVGGKRCGTTSLYEHLGRHPAVLPSRVRKGTHYFDVNYERGWRWYRSKFPSLRRAQREAEMAGMATISGEASPYYMFHPLAPRRIADALPGVRLVAVLRDPVARAHSHYEYSRHRGLEDLSFEEALDREAERLAGEVDRICHQAGYRSLAHRHHSYLSRGLYAEQIEKLHALFGPESVLVLQSEAMFDDFRSVLSRVFTFLGLPPVAIDSSPVYKAGKYEPLPLRTRRRLEELYAEPNERLYALPGIDFGWNPGGRVSRAGRS
jgi:sulfotransferase family protein